MDKIIQGKGQLTITVARTVMSELLAMQDKHGYKNRSQFVEEILRLGMPLFEQKLTENKEAYKPQLQRDT